MSDILFLTPYYPPEVGAPQTRISETATRLVKRGHRVTVLTTLPNYPSGIVPPEYRGRRNQHECLDGVRVERVWSFIRPNKGFLNRIAAQLSYGCLAALLGARVAGHPDVIIVESPPLFDAISGRLLARIKRCPFVFMVADPWPAAAVQMGLLRNRTAIRLAEALEWSTYRRAAAVWTVTERWRSLLIQQGLPEGHVCMVPNGVDCSLFRPRPQSEARAALGWAEKFTVLFGGTIGLQPGLMTLLDAAEHLRDQEDVEIVLLGDGSFKADLAAEASRRGLRNVSFRDALPHDQLPIAVAAADVCFVGLRRLAIFEGTMPVKCYEAMACARPIVLAAAPGAACDLCVDQAGAAIAVEPEDAAGIADAIRRLRVDSQMCEQLGQRGRRFVEAHFDRDKLVDLMELRLGQLLQGSKRSR